MPVDALVEAPSSLDFSRSFLEAQLPVSKLSKECYKERKSNYSQTLTGLGKWWGRKPLILVRATVLGLLRAAVRTPPKPSGLKITSGGALQPTCL